MATQICEATLRSVAAIERGQRETNLQSSSFQISNSFGNSILQLVLDSGSSKEEEILLELLGDSLDRILSSIDQSRRFDVLSLPRFVQIFVERLVGETESS